MKSPYLADDAFLADVQQARGQPDLLHIWWMGQSGFLVLWQGNSLLFDPYLSDSLTEKYAHTDKPHVRLTGRVVDPSRLDFLQVVASTHNHTDHLDGATLRALIAASPHLRLVVPDANRLFVAERLECDPSWLVGVDDGVQESVGAFRFFGVPAAHETIERDDLGRCKMLGYVVQVGPWTLYHSGDTIHYPEMNETLRRWPIDVALLPINGRAPERRVAGNLDGAQAAQLAQDVGVGLVIPCHYDMFEFNTATPDDFIVTCESLGQPYRVLENGQRVSLPDPRSEA